MKFEKNLLFVFIMQAGICWAFVASVAIFGNPGLLSAAALMVETAI
jgi:hypothetical protein